MVEMPGQFPSMLKLIQKLITNYVQIQFRVISSNISMIIMYYEYMTTQYFVRFFLSI
jgi:hypothetical protein